jgi:phenylpropionate dioxygenase-like ring-hydroxylating dioxygenase large terminal subunit
VTKVRSGQLTERGVADVAMSELAVPWGWFAVGFSYELGNGKVLARRLAGEELVVWRGVDGSVAATSSTCPHLGADLAGGRVEDCAIRCPFHGFRFDGDGRCVGTGAGSAPPAGLLIRAWPIRERNGLLLVWHHPEGAPPSFEVEEMSAEPMTGLGRTTTACFTFNGHPMATSENSVDVSHLAEVHHYSAVVMEESFNADGPVATASYSMTRPFGIPGDARLPVLRRAATQVRFDVTLFGLGVSLVEASIPALAARTRQFVLATPIDPGRVELRLTMQVLHDGGRIRSVAEQIAARFATLGFMHDVRQDIPIWGSQRYQLRPALAHGDGPIMPYRRWARQFLDTTDEVEMT